MISQLRTNFMLEIFQGPSVEGTDVIEDWLPVEDLRSLFVPLIGHFNIRARAFQGR